MINRRDFLQTAMAAAAALQAPTLLRAQAPSDRVQVGLIGCGNRGNQVANDWMKHKDTVIVAACDVARDRLDQTSARLSRAQGDIPVSIHEDYRRILERKDIDAVLIATPDHWHAPMTIDALDAGKDIYLEKPISNTVDAAVRMLDASRKSDRIIQVGLQQRSWHHFQEASKLFQDGYIGRVNHVQMCPPGGGYFGGPPQPPQQPQAPPEGFNWEMFQGPAERKPFVPARRSWRGWYDYGGGNLVDWGVHLTDVMNWFMRMDNRTPLLTGASAQYVRLARDPERVPDTYAVTWQFDTFVATLSNAMLPGQDGPQERYGNHFFGDRGVLRVNRMGYEVVPYQPPSSSAARGNAPPPQPIEPKKFKDPSGMSEVTDSAFGSATHRHVRNFLDSVKSRQKPVCDMEIGFNSTLPCLLALVSVKTGQTVKWDGKNARPT